MEAHLCYILGTRQCTGLARLDALREPEPSDPVFKKCGPLPRRAMPQMIKKRIQCMVAKADLRLPESKNYRRLEVPMMNGFRRFWKRSAAARCMYGRIQMG